jgi:mono/diheme cytochrome c family protein
MATKRRRRRRRWLVLAAVAALVALLASPALVRAYWSSKSSNPVRRGVALAMELGCFECHGELGRRGIPDPNKTDDGVPGWGGGVWMMYVENDDEVRQYILDGELEGHVEEHDEAIEMPAYRDYVDDGEVDDLVAAFKVLSGMSVPPSDSAARRGLDVARRWQCFSCHGAAGSGGLPNPGSFTGFIPGWYGADFDDLVRDRGEFDEWIREGSIKRLRQSRVARYFIGRQRIQMPEYGQLTPEELDDLWAYARWLRETDGGHRGSAKPW